MHGELHKINIGRDTHIILHLGTNDVPTEKDPDQIAENISPSNSRENVMSQYQTSQQERINARGKQQI